jgi:hypothetical protein
MRQHQHTSSVALNTYLTWHVAQAQAAFGGRIPFVRKSFQIATILAVTATALASREKTAC